MAGWLSNVWAAVLNALINTYDILFQTWGMRHLPKHIDNVGDSVDGLTAIVTGPTRLLHANSGEPVVLACRSAQRGEDLRKALLAAAAAVGKPEPSVEVRLLDLASLDSVRRFVAAWEAEKRPLHILVNNAGVFTIGGAAPAPRSETKDGFEMHIGSNHLGHFALTLGLLPSLRRGGSATDPRVRIVNVSSSYHMLARGGLCLADPHLKRPGAYTADIAYSQSKLANVLFTRELRRRLAPSDPALAAGSLVLHPGLVCTGVARDLPAWMRAAYYAIMGRVLLNCMQGARASIYCATSRSAPGEGAATAGYFNSTCRPTNPAPAGQDDAQALWLWRWSVEQASWWQRAQLGPRGGAGR
ncbi:hypothetical protein GPECTOR_42g769 [Gonium pectorale]|uniref:Retinol dehydrogenase 12 n=1 Tax=Gonium pectorale TaxID=33097 RepID=A0A150GB21_GONPE|nr:hypothetical protein GPECTOR_42g769 [Gonium pectorale]|eukprot:KXZ46560.1 hypothetical protein GPECTOR_42g769 [Gonium pectorale]